VDGRDENRPARERPGDGSRRMAGEVFEAHVRARIILEEAEAAARALLDEARAEVESWRAAAQASGWEDGRARAAAEVVKGVRERDRMLVASREEILDVACALAGRVLSRAVLPGSDAVEAAGRAVAEVRGSLRATLRVSPGDAPAVQAASGRLAAGVERLRVVEDDALSPGEVVVEADGARVDGRFPAQLAELRRAIAELDG